MVILIVEDQEVMRTSLHDFLRPAFPDSTIMDAENAERALALCLEHRPRLVLMDVSLPDANGIELTARIKALLPDTAVIVVSQYGAQTYIDRAREAGAFTYITKDKVYRELVPAVARALAAAGASVSEDDSTVASESISASTIAPAREAASHDGRTLHSMLTAVSDASEPPSRLFCPSQPMKRSTLNGPTNGRVRILIVEDQAADAELVVRELVRAGIASDARRVDTAAEYRRELAEFEPQVILSDFSMLKFSGIEALTIAREQYPDIFFIFATGAIGEEQAIVALKQGANDYVLKTNLARLPFAVKRAMVEAGERRARRSAERDLREVESFKSAIIHTTLDCVVTIDGEGHVIDFNPAAEATFGYARQEALGRELAELIVPPALREAHRRGLRHFQATGQSSILSKRIEVSAMRKDGSEFPVELTIVPIHLADRTIFSSHMRDITERKRSETALRDSELRFRQLAERSPDATFIHQEGKIVFANDALVHLMRAGSAADLLGIPGTTLLHPEEFPAVEPRFRQLYSGHSVPLDEQRYVRLDGSVVDVEIAASPIALEGKPAAIVTVRDISERKEQQKRIARLSRIHAVLSGTNSAIVRIRDRNEMFQEACRIAVTEGEFRAAWIGTIDLQTQEGTVVAWSSVNDGYINKLSLTARADTPYSDRPACRAVREMRPVITNDISAEPGLTSLSADLIKHGHRSAAAFPLVAGKGAVAVLVLHAAEVGFFDEEELKLLNELVGDIAFNLQYIEKEEKLNYLAYYDALTGLPNSTLFKDRLTQFVHAATRNAGRVAAIIVNLDRFRYLNDSLGRHSGDALLKLVGKRLVEVLREPFSVARTGADTFALAVAGLRHEDDVVDLLRDRVFPALGEPFEINGTEIRVSAKAGVVLYPGDGSDAEILLRNAEAALKQAKSSGEKYLFYTPEMNARVAEKLALETKLRRALDREEFVLHYQPKVDMASGRLCGLEALIRWNDPDTGLVPPAKFIPLLEETGLILEVGTWAMRRALEDARGWRTEGVAPPRVAVNVSALQLQQANFVDSVQQVVRAYGEGDCELDLEITESLVMRDIETTMGKLAMLREIGVQIAIDDFGTGYSSLGYLAKLPVNALKIDRSFIAGLTTGPESAAIVSTIITLANSLGLSVIAEGVETDGQADILRRLKCDEMQGYLFSKPLPPEEIGAFLRRWTQPIRSAQRDAAT